VTTYQEWEQKRNDPYWWIKRECFDFMSEFDTSAEYHFNTGHAMVLSTIDGAVKTRRSQTYTATGDDAIQRRQKEQKDDPLS
jgi:hypothetical protein